MGKEFYLGLAVFSLIAFSGVAVYALIQSEKDEDVELSGTNSDD